MRILAHLQTSYAPNASSGADVMAERINTFLVNKEHEVICAIDKCNTPYTYNGVQVVSNRQLVGERYDWCDIVITHLVNKGEAVRVAERFNKPIFHVVHTGNLPPIPYAKNNYLIYNTHTLKDQCGHSLPSIVVNPPTWLSEWQQCGSASNPFITLINCTSNKGHDLFASIAQAMPHHRFLGIHGGYGQQGRRVMPNLIYRGFTPGMQEIYAQTKILLVPSISESWSLAAAEAQACGIPVICSDLPGLRENMGDSALYCSTTRAYMDAINEVMSNYARWSCLGIIQAGKRNAIHAEQLNNLNNYMEQVVKEKKEYAGLPTATKQDKPLTPEPVPVADTKIKTK